MSTETSSSTPEPDVSREAAWREHLLAVESQALDDLARTGASEVLFIRQAKATGAWEFLDPLEARGLAEGFVTARVTVLADQAFDSFDGLVRALARNLTAPGSSAKKRGLLSLLDRFASKFDTAQAALAAFDKGAMSLHASGDLLELSRAYIDAKRKPTAEARRIEAWLSGTELARAEADNAAFAALSPRTARRALGELTRLVRVLGWRGTLAIFAGAEVLTKLPAGRREDAYTVLRELIDNADGGRGLVSMQSVISGAPALFDGARGLSTLAPLSMRIEAANEGAETLPPPHRPILDASPPANWSSPSPAPTVVQPCAYEGLPALRTLIRAARGLPSAEPVVTMSVGHEKIDATITSLFSYAAMESSVFALLTGAYGTCKSHLLMHLTARALADKRPVFRLSLERLDMDLGNPQRHLRRLLEHGALPLPGRPGPLDRLVAWTRSPKQLERLVKALRELDAAGGEASAPAHKALAYATKAKSVGVALESWLGATELLTKNSNANYRFDAYQRLILWLALLAKLEGCGGPVLLIDEAENLYRGGTSRVERRTALRSLSFYCGGTLPGACVVMAITPDSLGALRAEATELLEDVAEQRTVLAWEDAAMLKRRLTALEPIAVPALTSQARIVLAFRVQATHTEVRGRVSDPSWIKWVEALVKEDIPPRTLVRRVVDRLERLWWVQHIAVAG